MLLNTGGKSKKKKFVKVINSKSFDIINKNICTNNLALVNKFKDVNILQLSN